MRPTVVPPATGHLASADDNPAGRLLGAWRLLTNLRRMEDTGEVVERHDPRGYAVFESGSRMIVVMATAGRSPLGGDAEAAPLFNNITAYTGRYCVEENRLTVAVDVAWHPDWEGTEQVRFVDLDGERLTLSTGVQEHPSMPGRKFVGSFTWGRERWSRWVLTGPPRGRGQWPRTSS